MRGRIKWSEEELQALEGAMRVHGNKWAAILADYGAIGRINRLLANRSQINIKDKARNERSRRERAGVPLGVWGLAPK
jgi:hypothetical protein